MPELGKKRDAPSYQGEGQARNSNEVYVLNDNKPQPLRQPSVVAVKALDLLNRHATKSSGGFISLPECRRIFSWLYHLSKIEVYQFLKELEDAGLISQINSHGVKIIKHQEEGN